MVPDAKLSVNRVVVVLFLLTAFIGLLSVSRHSHANSLTDSPGTLDPSFGPGGIVITPIGDPSAPEQSAIFQIVIQPDGKVVAVGYGQDIEGAGVEHVVLTRYNPDGSLDSSFGTGGIAADPSGIFDPNSVPSAGALQSDGKIVAAGFTSDSTGQP